MGIVGGNFAYRFLRRNYPGGQNTPMPEGDPWEGDAKGKLLDCFGDDIFETVRGKRVLDLGCGPGSAAVELARQGCAMSIGVDIQESHLAAGRVSAEKLGLADRVMFTSSWTDPVDMVLSMDAFEHFDDPEGALVYMRSILNGGGELWVSFGPTWYHPYGGHLFSVFPWAHLVFTEDALIRWRSDFKSDGARKFNEVAGGLNGMTIRRWEKMITESKFRVQRQELVPIRVAARFHNAVTREFLTAVVRARLIAI